MTADQILGLWVGILTLTIIASLTASWLADRRNRRRAKKRKWKGSNSR